VVLRRPLAVLCAVVLAPFVVLLLWAVAHGGLAAPSGDVALLEVRVGDVLVGGRTPLVGSYQRYGFNQPGPLLLYALAVPYRLLGSSYRGLEIGALALGAVSIVGALRVAWRRGGRLGSVWAGALIAVLVHGHRPPWLLDPWEPHVLVLVGLALFFASFDAAMGGRSRSLVWCVLCASLIAQAWATMLPFAVALTAWATVGVIVDAGRSRFARQSAFRALVVSAVLGFVLWLPPLYEQLTPSGGNVTAALRALGSPAEPAVGLVDGARAVGTELGPRASWLGFPQRLDGLSPTLDLGAGGWTRWLGVAALLLATAFASVSGSGRVERLRERLWRPEPLTEGGDVVAAPDVRDLATPPPPEPDGARPERAWVVGATAAVAIAASVVAMGRLLGPVFVWLPRWLRVVGLATWFAVGWCLAATTRGLDGRIAPTARRTAEVALAGITVVFAALSVVDAVTHDPPADPLGAAARRLVRSAELDDLPEPVLVVSTADAALALGGDDVAIEVLVHAVERRGFETRVAADVANRFGPQRAEPDEAVAELRLIRADDELPAEFVVVAETDPLTAAQRTRRTELLAQAGLPPDATDADLLHRVSDDPSLRGVAEQVRRIPELPPLRLVRHDRPERQDTRSAKP
jgi:hypothetical protein